MSGGATARLFVAVDPPEECCRALAEWARAVAAGAGQGEGRAGLRVLDAQSLHVTLCFLGHRPVAEIDSLAACLRAHTLGVGELSVGAPLWLPARRPRSLAVEIHDRDGGLSELRERVCADLAQVSGWEPERRRFRAHVTVARVRGGAGRSHGGGPLGGGCLPATPGLDFVPDALVMYRSWLAREGAVYEALARSEPAPAER